MAIRPIRTIGDLVLRTVCNPIMGIMPNIKAFVGDLLKGIDMGGRAGLAASQIGASLRAFSWNADGEIDYMLNPRIVVLSEDEYQDGNGGRLSVPEPWYPTERARCARCEGTDLGTKKIVAEGGGLMVHYIQHECDHLDGRIYIGRLDRATRKKVLCNIRNAGF